MTRRRRPPTAQLDLAGIRASDKIAFSPKEVARFMGCGLPSAYYIAARIGTRVGPKGGRWKVSREALMQYLEHKGATT